MPTVTTTVTTTAAEGTTTATTTTTAPDDPRPEKAVPSPAGPNNSIDGASAGVHPAKIFLDTPGATVDLRGKVALVTGASRGIGQAIAEHLAAKGMKVVLTARSVSDLAKICDDIKAKGGEAAHIKYDAESTAEAKAAFEFAEATFGPVYLVCANSGFADLKEMDDITEDDVDRIFAVNQKAPFMAFSLARSHFKKNGGGCWVVTSSLAASLQREQFAGAPASMALYSSGKAAVVDMARAFGVKYADENVRAYAICPAVYTTKLVTDLLEDFGASSADEVAAGFNPIFPGKSGDPAHVGTLMGALAANTSLYPSGAAVVVDNDVTCSLEMFHKRMDTYIDPAAGEMPYDVDATVCKDLQGFPLTKEKMDAIVAGCSWAHA